jgi:hypothetical protein
VAKLERDGGFERLAESLPTSRHANTFDFGELLADFALDAFICRMPYRQTSAWAAASQTPTLPVFADAFRDGGLRNGLAEFAHRARCAS